MKKSADSLNMDEMYLTSLRDKGYRVDFLVEGNELIYVITKQEGDKTLLGCYTSNGWFNGETFGANECWWGSISTQEYEGDTTVVFEGEGKMIMCGVIGDTFIPGKKSDIGIDDILGAFAAQVGGKLN